MQLFISHSWADKPIIRRLMELPEYISIWIDESQMAAGDELDQTVKNAIEDSHLFLLMVSQSSISKEWVAKELRWAQLCAKKHNDRTFIIPILIENDIDLDKSEEPFSALANRIYLDASDTSDAGIANSQNRILETILQWCCERVLEYEPVGSSDRLFADKVESDLVTFQDHLYRIKATLENPIHALVKPDAQQHMSQAKETYNEFTKYFIPELASMDDVIRWRFKPSYRSFQKLSEFILEDVYRGAAYALNDIVKAINSYESVLQHDDTKYDNAEETRKQRVQELNSILERMSIESRYFIDSIKSQ